MVRCKKIGKHGPYTGVKRQWIKTVPKGAQMSDLLDKNFQWAIDS